MRASCSQKIPFDYKTNLDTRVSSMPHKSETKVTLAPELVATFSAVAIILLWKVWLFISNHIEHETATT